MKTNAIATVFDQPITANTPTAESELDTALPSGREILADLTDFIALETGRSRKLIRNELQVILGAAEPTIQQLPRLLAVHQQLAATRCLTLLWHRWQHEAATGNWTIENAARWLVTITDQPYSRMIRRLTEWLPKDGKVNAPLVQMLNHLVPAMIEDVRSATAWTPPELRTP